MILQELDSIAAPVSDTVAGAVAGVALGLEGIGIILAVMALC